MDEAVLSIGQICLVMLESDSYLVSKIRICSFNYIPFGGNMNTQNVTDIAKRFAEFYAKFFTRPSEGNTYSKEVLALLLEVVQSAGFDVNHVEVGKMDEIRGYDYEDATVNTHCPFRVLTSQTRYSDEIILRVGRGDNAAWMTGWLDCLFSILADVSRKTSTENLNEVLASRTQEEILRAQPLPLIRITSEGDCLTEIPPDKNNPPDRFLPGIFDHTRDENPLPKKGKVLGIHKNHGCGSELIFCYENGISKIVHCPGCSLRITFPKTIETYGELRAYFTQQLRSKGTRY